MVRAVYEGRESELVAHTLPLLWPTRTIRSGENGSQSQSVQSCPHQPTTREIYEPIVYQLGIADGIVKHGSAIGVSVFVPSCAKLAVREAAAATRKKPGGRHPPPCPS
jgi:hypothetical protein